MNEDFNNVEPFNPQAQVIDKIKDEVALVRTDMEYQTAITVAKPRNLALVRDKALAEARIGKNEMWYTWQVKNKKTGKKEWLPPGGTIGLAQGIMRAFGNCAMNTTVREEGGYWIFKSVFIDIENGVTTTRELRQRIPSGQNEHYSPDRWYNMQFQIAQSKNQRDVILNGTPRWLTQECIEEAQEASKVKTPEAQAALEKGLSFFKQYDVSEKELCIYFGKISLNEFTLDDITKMRNLGAQLKNGNIKAQEIKDQAKDIFDYEKAQEGDKNDPEPKQQEEPEKKKAPKKANKKAESKTKKPNQKKPEIPQEPEPTENDMPTNPFDDAPTAESAEETAQKAMLQIHQDTLQEVKDNDSLLYEAGCDSLFIKSDILPTTIDACEILIAKIIELGKRRHK